MLLLRATLESSLQGQLNLAESQCHKVPSFFSADAGEARREVLALRKHKEESQKELTDLQPLTKAVVLMSQLPRAFAQTLHSDFLVTRFQALGDFIY